MERAPTRTAPAERRLAAAALVAGPALFLVANLLHPKEYATGNEAAQLEKIADAYHRWQAAHLVTFVAIPIFAVAVVALAALIWPRDRRSARGGAVLGMFGLLALMGVLALLALGSLLTGLEGAIHSNAYFVAASLALLAGGAAVAASLHRAST